MSQTCGHDHSTPGGLSGGALEAALAEAESRCRDGGDRLTPPRRRVLELLLRAGQPAKAYDLINAYGDGGEAAKPPTVYRALDFLERTGLAHKIATLSAYVACAQAQAAHVAAFLICDCCGDTREIETGAGLDLGAAAHGRGYVLSRVSVEAHGLCSACRES